MLENKLVLRRAISSRLQSLHVQISSVVWRIYYKPRTWDLSLPCLPTIGQEHKIESWEDVFFHKILWERVTLKSAERWQNERFFRQALNGNETFTRKIQREIQGKSLAERFENVRAWDRIWDLTRDLTTLFIVREITKIGRAVYSREIVRWMRGFSSHESISYKL